MKVAVSIPDALFAKADALAAAQGKSRSLVYQEALAAHVARHSPDAITEQMNAALADLGEDAIDWWVVEAGHSMRNVEW
jgi:predicted transcriptional regulator